MQDSERAPPSLHAPTVRSKLMSTGYVRGWVTKHLNSFARERIFAVLRQGLSTGQLVVEDEEGTFEFGLPTENGHTVTVKVHDANMWSRIALSNDLGVAEAYMNSEFDVSDLRDLLNLWLDNRVGLAGMENGLNGLFSRYSALAIKALGRQSIFNARRNVELAYNTSNSFFQTFLSDEMMYSCAIWSDSENGVRGDLTVGPAPGDLEAAQQRKIKLLLTKARLRPGDRLLEIGSGWGAMAIAAAKMGCTVDTITLSQEQLELAVERAHAAGVSDRVRVHICDYRAMPPEFEHAFDALVSSEMIEAVGPRYMPAYFRAIDWALKKDRATMVITSTSCPEHRYTEYQPDDFARHYHWPNHFAPSATSLALAVQDSVPGAFVLNNFEDHGPHYPRTLREWGRRFEKNFQGSAVEEMRHKYPALRDPKELEAFKRKWRYLFVYAEVGFARAYATLNCWTFARPENIEIPCD